METEKPKFHEINQNSLDQEWVKHSSRYHKYANKLADAKRKVAEAKANLEVTEAEVSLELRRHPKGKMTDAAIKSAVVVDQRVRQAVRDYILAKHEQDIYEAAVNTLEHRKRTLENLVSLRLADYYSEPKAKGVARDQMEEVSKREVRTRGQNRGD